jgi:5-methylcytosine-specific restriction endonuclease McrA
MSTGNEAVLLLNSTYEPLNVINLRRAVRLLITEKADSVEANGRSMPYGNGKQFRVPEVVRLSYYVKRPQQRVKFTKSAVFIRDNYTCQYCGVQTKDLTVDHVIPKVKDGGTVWTNIVAACKRCNNRKGDKTPKDAGLKLLRPPKEPRFLPYLRMVRRGHQQSWDKYLFADSDSPYLVRDALPTGY